MDSSTSPRRRQRLTARPRVILDWEMTVMRFTGWCGVAAGLLTLASGFVRYGATVDALDDGVLIFLAGVLILRMLAELRAERRHADALQRVVDDLDVTFVDYSNGSRTYTVHRYDDSD